MPRRSGGLAVGGTSAIGIHPQRGQAAVYAVALGRTSDVRSGRAWTRPSGLASQPRSNLVAGAG